MMVLRLAFQPDAPPTKPKATTTDRQTETETEKGDEGEGGGQRKRTNVPCKYSLAR